jgi:antitoxin component YwqK of YwqJK toxin-antitoxin module
MKSIGIIVGLLSLLMTSCTSEKQVKEQTNEVAEEQLIEESREWYREYYPGKKQLKMHGTKDDQGRRHGVWEYFTETGVKLSATYYLHGKKDGFSVVYYPTGTTHYVGEYKDDKKVGLWRTYDTDGNLVSENSFDE